MGKCGLKKGKKKNQIDELEIIFILTFYASSLSLS